MGKLAIKCKIYFCKYYAAIPANTKQHKTTPAQRLPRWAGVVQMFCVYWNISNIIRKYGLLNEYFVTNRNLGYKGSYLSLTSVTLTSVTLARVTLTRVTLTSVTLTRVTLTRVTLASVTLASVSLTSVTLTEVTLTRVTLTSVTLTSVTLTSVR